ncbi:MAG: transporter substrate-binding protein [Frondihabitans sp.]|nr:transporter substrate-binding protein [Frondihabitans sp.]
MKKSSKRVAAIASALVIGLCLTACSSGGGTPTSTKPANISFWGWAPGYAAAVKSFNASQSKIHVTYQEVTPGAKGGYTKMLTAVKANNAPCLAQVGYETLPSFAAQGALQDVSKYADADKNEFQPAAWKSVSVGSNVYGAPVDTGPMVMFYNKSDFTSLGLPAPTTWAEYEADAVKIHAADPQKYISSPYLDYDYAGLAWQKDASWFGVKGDAWQVNLTSKSNLEVANYWQGLIDKKLISSAPMYDQSWYTGLGNGDIATVVGAVWQAGVISGGAANGSGKWAVAPMPQWSSGQTAVGNAGGSATAVLKGCSSPSAAWDFANYMSTNRSVFGNLVTTAGLYPAAKSLSNLPELTKGDTYFGGQKIYQVVANAAPQVQTGWTWGPTMTQTAADLDDALGKAWSGQGETISSALSSTQTKTIAALKSQGLSVVK